MLRVPRPREVLNLRLGHMRSPPEALLMELAPPPRTMVVALSGWPEWLVPSIRLTRRHPKVASGQARTERSP